MSNEFTASTAKIVAAFARNNRLGSGDLPALIDTVNTALGRAGEPDPAPRAEPVVTARQSVKPDSITCMTCGRKFKSMKRHLMTEHGQTPQVYREQWALPPDYPMVASTYSAARSELAKAIGLGAKGRRPAAATVAVAKVVESTAKSKAKPHPKPSARKKTISKGTGDSAKSTQFVPTSDG
jgi:predicted transcriptional regulator